MNFSLINKVVWLSSEFTQGQLIRDIFKNYSFFKLEGSKSKKIVDLLSVEESNEDFVDENYKDYTKIVTIRNPYDRVWDYYINFHTKNYRLESFSTTKDKFNEFLNKSFITTLDGVILSPFFGTTSYLNKWRFLNYLPDEIIRYENIFSDILNLKFINNQPLKFDLVSFKEKFEKIKINSEYKNFYTFENAQKVFNFYKKTFFYLESDPFSFTNKTLDDRDKIKFVHGYE